MVQEYSVLKIEPSFKKHVIQFQSLIQSKTGKYISQGRAAGLACVAMMAIIEDVPEGLHKDGLHKEASRFDEIRTKLVEISERISDGDLIDFDIENMFDNS